jgi:hypothetical protein
MVGCLVARDEDLEAVEVFCFWPRLPSAFFFMLSFRVDGIDLSP